MKFSLLIANYNNGIFFKDCYDSIVSQTYTDWEVIVVDDRSTDDSIEVINNLIRDDKRFTLYVNDKNYGCGYTKHKCAGLATGEICGFVDPDDALVPNALQEHSLCYQQYNDHVLIYSGYFLCNEKLVSTGITSQSEIADTTDKYYFNLKGQVTHFATFVRNAYNKTSGIDEWMRRAVDQDLYLKMSEVGSFYFLDKPLYLYRHHTGGISNPKNGDTTYFWKWYAITQAAKRRDINIEDLFTQHFIKRTHYERIKKYYNNSWRLKVYRQMASFKNFLKHFC